MNAMSLSRNCYMAADLGDTRSFLSFNIFNSTKNFSYRNNISVLKVNLLKKSR
jgi:hypothetical protein